MLEHEFMEMKADRKAREMMIGKMLMDYGFLTRDTIGESRCARPIDMLCVGNRRKQVLFAGAFHGMEWITSLILLKFLDELCFSVMTGQAMCGVKMGVMLNQRGLAVIPCVNPDGVEIQIHGAESAGNYAELVRNAGETSKWQAFRQAGTNLKSLNLKTVSISRRLRDTEGSFPKASLKHVVLHHIAVPEIFLMQLLFTVRERKYIGISEITMTLRL